MDRDSCAGLAATLGAAPELVHLEITGCALGASDTSELFSSMRTCTRLEHLDLSSNGLGVFSARNLTHVLRACRELQTLKLAANALYGVALTVSHSVLVYFMRRCEPATEGMHVRRRNCCRRWPSCPTSNCSRWTATDWNVPSR